MKKTILGGAIAFILLNPFNANPRKIEFDYIFNNECIGTHTIHSFLGFTWDTHEVVAYP